MSDAPNRQVVVLLVTTSVIALFLQFLLATLAITVTLGYISSPKEYDAKYESFEGISDGMDCLKTDGGGYSIDSKLHTLSCIGLHTSYSAWENQAAYLADCMAISRNRTLGIAGQETCAWLRPGNWGCSMLPPFLNGPHIACLRHDLNFATLQSLDGNEGLHTLDEFWNPRNKHLADERFRYDVRESSSDAPWPLARASAGLGAFMHWFTNKVNNKTWPVTVHDIEDTRESPYFRMCDVPTVKDVRVNLRERTAHAEWTYVPGCVDSIEAARYRTCWKVDLPTYLYILYPRALTGFCQSSDAASAQAKFTIPAAAFEWRSIKLESIEIRPGDIAYGGPFGSENILGSSLLDGIFGGAYYPVQKLNLRVAR